MKHFRYTLLVLLLVLAVPAAHGQTDPLMLDRWITLEQDPHEDLRLTYEAWDPDKMGDCHPHRLMASCAWVLWDDLIEAEIGQPYTASVGSRVYLHGPTRNVWFEPFVHCIIYDPDKQRQSIAGPGENCTTVLAHDNQRMEWSVGGTLETPEHLEPGEYQGSLTLTVERADNYWHVPIPITYTVHKAMSSCPTWSGSSTIPLGDLPAGFPGTVAISGVAGSEVNYRGALADEMHNCLNCYDAVPEPGEFMLRFVNTEEAPASMIIEARADANLSGAGSTIAWDPKIWYRAADTGAWIASNITEDGNAIDVRDIYRFEDELSFHVGADVTLSGQEEAGLYTASISLTLLCEDH